jgi:ferredoxin
MKCGEVCPTGALEVPAVTPEKEYGETRMGKAAVDEKICLPFNHISWCGACYTACPLKDIALKVDYRNRPTVLDGCVGCGLCVEVCPIRYKAISVDPPFLPDVGTVRKE